VVSLEVRPLRIPFRFAFGHHLAIRSESRPQLVRLQLSDGTVGHGEALPRPYLSGEDEASVQAALQGPLAALVLEREVEGLEGARAIIEGAAARQAREEAPAAFCGLELALLDAAGCSTGRPVSDLLGGARRKELAYDVAVAGFLPLGALALYLGQVRRRGVGLLKLKVGRPDDRQRVALARRLLGDGPALVLDANAAWSEEQAVAAIQALEHFGLTAVEQPVARHEVEALARVRRAVATPIVADESLCTLADARRLIEHDACDLWNLRVGKCGGLLATLELFDLAASHGIGCALGVLVGETGILAAAGRHVAASRDGFHWLEHDGAGLKRSEPAPLAAAADGLAPVPDGPGLGITLDEGCVAELADGPRAVAP
jgi:L-alanine-DL-glutamate epimerase-like enolase superfamily enzyme